LASNLKVYNFESGADSQLTIPLNLGNIQEQGYTICFRLKLKYWKDCTVFESENRLSLILYEYIYDVAGTLTFDQIAKHFPGTLDIKQFNSWQAFCLAYDAKTSNSKLYRDGIKISEAGSIVDKNGGAFDPGKWLKFGPSEKHQLIASMTDFNIWSG